MMEDLKEQVSNMIAYIDAKFESKFWIEIVGREEIRDYFL